MSEYLSNLYSFFQASLRKTKSSEDQTTPQPFSLYNFLLLLVLSLISFQTLTVVTANSKFYKITQTQEQQTQYSIQRGRLD